MAHREFLFMYCCPSDRAEHNQLNHPTELINGLQLLGVVRDTVPTEYSPWSKLRSSYAGWSMRHLFMRMVVQYITQDNCRAIQPGKAAQRRQVRLHDIVAIA